MNFSKHIANQLNKTSSFNNVDELIKEINNQILEKFNNYIILKENNIHWLKGTFPTNGIERINIEAVPLSSSNNIVRIYLMDAEHSTLERNLNLNTSQPDFKNTIDEFFDKYKSVYNPSLIYEITPKDVKVIPEGYENKGGEGYVCLFKIHKYITDINVKLENLAKKITSDYKIPWSKNDTQEEQAIKKQLQDQYVDEIVARFNEKLKTL